MSRQGGSGIGGGTAAGRHQAIRLPGRSVHSPRRQAVALGCTSCNQPVTGAAVVVAGSVYCTWDCAVAVAGTIPGQYFG